MNFNDIALHAGDRVRLMYVTDQDVDGLFDNEEAFFGTQPIDPDGPGGADPLVIKGDFFFSGEVPEPGVALLLGAAASALVVSAQRRGRRV